MHAIAADAVFDGSRMHDHHAALIEAGRILRLIPIAELPAGIDCERLPQGWLLAPGYVDLQVNGGGDVLFNDQPTPAGIAAIAAAHRRLGTTSLLPTLISGSAALLDTARAAAAIAMRDVPGIIGIHLEGPHLAPARRGIHPAPAIRPMEAADLASLSASFGGTLLITLAPELAPPGAIRSLQQAGAVVFAGHSEAGWQQMKDALAQGLRGVTHLFNAMAQIGPREPGTVGATLGLPGLYAGIILDGLHVHPANARLAYHALGPAQLFLVSDAMPTVGGSLNEFHIGPTRVRLRDGRLSATDGTLGGAHLCLAEAVRHAVSWLGAPIEAALAMATSTPADAIGNSEIGRLRAGTTADVLALDASLFVRAVWQHGQKMPV